MMNKRGVELPLRVIIVAAILLVVLFVSLSIYYGKMEENVSILDLIMGNMKEDCDGDKINDIFDKCPCVAGKDEYSGCPIEFDKLSDADKRQLPCPDVCPK